MREDQDRPEADDRDGTATLLPLVPTQQSLLHYAERPFLLTLEAPERPSAIADRLRRVLEDVPALRMRLREVPGMRAPRQAPDTVRMHNGPQDVVEIASGALTLGLEPSSSGSRLRLTGDWGMVDPISLRALVAAAAGGQAPDADQSERFAAIVTAYAQMAKEGELTEEDAYWRRVPSRSGHDPLHLAEAADGASRPRIAVLELDSDIGSSLSSVAQKWEVAADDVAYLALSAVLCRLSAEPLLGRVCDARPTLGLEGHIGAFSQILPDVPELAPEQPLRDAIRSQSERLAGHVAMAGGAALHSAGPRPALVFEPGDGWRLPPGWRSEEWCLGVHQAVTLRLASRDGRPVLEAGSLHARTGERLQALLEAWHNALTAILADPDGTCGQTTLLSPARTAVLRETLDVPVSGKPGDLCALVHEHAAQGPEKVAFAAGTRRVTRRELRQRIARTVTALGDTPPGSVVGVLADNSLDLLVGWLSVLWLNATVLPLSPEEPRKRLKDALENTKAAILLHQGGLAEIAAALHPRAIDLSQGPDGSARPPERCRPDDLAYLMRTSGSTGTPKIVAVTRGNLDNYLDGIARDLHIGERVMPWVAAPIFDAGLKQFLGPQYAGGTTTLLDVQRTDLGGVAEELAAYETAFDLNCVPSYWSALLDEFAAEAEPPLARLLLGGEPVSPRLLERTAERFPHTEVWNLYGPTEATATATAGRVAPDRAIDVGAGVAGAHVVVADRWASPLPEGFPGEVWLAGPGVARGYLEDGVVVPFGTMSVGGREIPAYRTGDLGLLSGGRLRLSGRKDRQVKIRGWRVDPQELEMVAERLTGTRATVLVSDRGEAALHLFYTGAIASEEMTAHLRRELPAAFMPTVTRVAAFPHTPTGKLDEQRLLTMMEHAAQVDPERDYSPAERVVARVWLELLGTDWPSPEADFFTVGGHSLALARVVSILRAEGHDRLTLKAAVRDPTIKAMARLLDTPGS
ncbi:AMP-binding protein [Actinomadura sp. ATCC 39365]